MLTLELHNFINFIVFWIYEKVEAGENDVVVVPANENKNAKTVGLKAILFESYSEDDVIVAVADNDVSSDILKKAAL